METVQQNGRFTIFLEHSSLIYILFSLFKTVNNLLELIGTKWNSKYGLPNYNVCTFRIDRIRGNSKKSVQILILLNYNFSVNFKHTKKTDHIFKILQVTTLCHLSTIGKRKRF